ncbi:hypothetical protein D1872_279620 [compost metagenome]
MPEQGRNHREEKKNPPLFWRITGELKPLGGVIARKRRSRDEKHPEVVDEGAHIFEQLFAEQHVNRHGHRAEQGQNISVQGGTR